MSGGAAVPHKSDGDCRGLVLVVVALFPLLLAAPVTFRGGMSRTAHAGIIVKNGGTLERLVRVKTPFDFSTARPPSGSEKQPRWHCPLVARQEAEGQFH